MRVNEAAAMLKGFFIEVRRRPADARATQRFLGSRLAEEKKIQETDRNLRARSSLQICATIKVVMSELFRFRNAVERDPAVEGWMEEHNDELGTIARQWFEVMRGCGKDVRELLHDGHPTACVGDAAFAYVNAFKAHVNVGFFRGGELHDPKSLLEGTGKVMRHVKLSPHRDVDPGVLRKLIRAAYADMKRRLRQDRSNLRR